ncbi:MAG: InlB B-repeat-containing protein [Dehalococcoidia bacterium]
MSRACGIPLAAMLVLGFSLLMATPVMSTPRDGVTHPPSEAGCESADSVNAESSVTWKDTVAAASIADGENAGLSAGIGVSAAGITVTATEGRGATIDPEEAQYDLADPVDVSTTITWNDATGVDSVVDGNGVILLEGVDYRVDLLDDTARLTITHDYLTHSLLAVGDEAQLTIKVDGYPSAVLTITAIAEGAVVEYSLTISSGEGGSVTGPGEGTFTYEAGRVVNLEAKPDEGYGFLRWMGEVDTVADTSVASTNITMHGSYNITASFGQEIVVQESPDWRLVAGIIAAAIAVALVALSVRRRRAARRE